VSQAKDTTRVVNSCVRERRMLGKRQAQQWTPDYLVKNLSANGRTGRDTAALREAFIIANEGRVHSVKGSKEEAPVWPRALTLCVYKKLSYTFEWCALIFYSLGVPISSAARGKLAGHLRLLSSAGRRRLSKRATTQFKIKLCLYASLNPDKKKPLKGAFFSAPASFQPDEANFTD
jgi:hypothetical protein